MRDKEICFRGDFSYVCSIFHMHDLRSPPASTRARPPPENESGKGREREKPPDGPCTPARIGPDTNRWAEVMSLVWVFVGLNSFLLIFHLFIHHLSSYIYSFSRACLVGKN